MRKTDVVVTPTTPADVDQFCKDKLPFRIRAVTGRVNGEIKGIGGVTTLPDGTLVAFLEASEDDCKRYPVALHRAARRFLADMEARGIHRIVARLDSTRDAAGRWLERLGFKPTSVVDGETYYTWQR